MGARDRPFEPIAGNPSTIPCLQHTVIEIEKIIAEDSFVSNGSNISIPLEMLLPNGDVNCGHVLDGNVFIVCSLEFQLFARRLKIRVSFSRNTLK